MIRRILPLLAAILLAGCDFTAPPPVLTPAPPVPPVPLSTLSATLTIPDAQLARLLNNMTAYQLGDFTDQPMKCGFTNCRLDLHAERTGPAAVTARDGALTVAIPFAVNVSAKGDGFFSFVRAKGDGRGVAIARTGLSMGPDWSLRSRAEGSVHLDDGHLRIGPLVTSIAQIWNGNEKSLSRPLWQSLDRSIHNVNLRRPLNDLWREAFTPFRLGKSPASWLVLRPEQIAVAQPVIRNGMVTFSLGIAARGQVVVQDAMPGNPPIALPAAQHFAGPPKHFSFTMPLLLPYGRAGALAMAALKKHPPQVTGANVAISDLKILPSGQDVVVQVGFCADPRWDSFGWLKSCGTAYLRGTPVFDASAQAIRVDNLHYDLSGGLLLHLVRWLAGGTLTELVQKGLVFDESRAIAKLKTQVVTAIARPEGGPVSISGQVQSFGAPRLTWTKDGFLATFSASGTVSTSLNL